MTNSRDKLAPAIRMIVRYVALGLTDTDICVEFPEYTPLQIAKLRAGGIFKKALAEIQAEIETEMVARAGEDPVRAYLRSKGLKMAQTLTEVAEDEEAPHSSRVKAADSVLAKAGYAAAQDVVQLPVLMISQEKLNSVLAPRPDVLKDVPDYVDGHSNHD